jgi:carboxymethylenebutenolidase
MSSPITFTAQDGSQVSGEIALPAGEGKAPGLVLVQEWWGLNDHIRSLLDRFAAAGFITLAPDLYHGKIATDAAEAGALMTALDGKRALGDIAAAAQHLLAQPRVNGKVGVTGFCMGGALTLLAAVNVPEMDVGVVWYGYPPLEYIDASKIKAPLLAHWAIHDHAFPIAAVDQLEQKLRAAHAKFDFHRYDAKHAFANETIDSKNLDALRYDPDAAKVAWQRTLDFLSKHLS